MMTPGYFLLIAFLFLTLILVTWYKRKLNHQEGKANSKIRVLEKAFLDNKTKLFVIEYEGSKHFIVSNSASVSVSQKIEN
ncbi:hypothetical protein KDD30_05270 [Photobacterium sp. GJ3]|uniref:hypothetical protein n=1 Tax=Photobacterium sp. GJ3 TaxID=2829502 RepID=UPI001B8D6D2F|nr:hypothetical protein [Photobacterium sp. GJ3]QUJ68526.1 hypothetical protein KDD30_05270 [Photobacterium sp. GJ3]